MGWFAKSEKKVPREINYQGLPELPRLPDFPNPPEMEDDNFTPKIHQLPSFPANSIGEKFSQNTIKEAVTGKKEVEEVLRTDDFADIDKNIRMMEEPQEASNRGELPFIRKENKHIMSKKAPDEFKEAIQKIKNIQPVFIRIDKFEEGLNNLEKTRVQISEIEKMLKDIQKIKEEEEQELTLWENEINSAKEKIEKIERDIFSKIE
ncbi:MAG: hypothetical protein AABW81_01540 [Nanoarchaeota archaeon]